MASSSKRSQFQELQGSDCFRLRIQSSILTSKKLKIKNIRSDDIDPGLRDYEISFLNLIAKVTNGTKIDISSTGTMLKFEPGIITNQQGIIYFDSCPSRNITWYIEGIIVISMFSKFPLSLVINGVTNNTLDCSADYLKFCLFPLLKQLLSVEVQIQIIKRGINLQDGRVSIKINPIREPVNIQLVEQGLIKRIRGVS